MPEKIGPDKFERKPINAFKAAVYPQLRVSANAQFYCY